MNAERWSFGLALVARLGRTDRVGDDLESDERPFGAERFRERAH